MIKFFKDGGGWLLLWLVPMFVLGAIIVPINWLWSKITGRVLWA